MADWSVVSQAVDDPATPAFAPPSKWQVQAVVKEPADGDPYTGPSDAVPEGFHAVTDFDSGSQTLRRNLEGGDIAQMLGDLPGVGTAMNIGAGAINTVKKAASGIAGLFGADPKQVQGEPLQAPPSNDPILAALGAAGNAASAVAAPVDEAIGNLPPGPRTAIEGVEEAIPEIAGLAGARAPLKGVGPSTTGIAETIATSKGLLKEAKGEGTDWHKAGLRTGGGHPLARQVAGDSGPEALKGHNAEVGNAVAASESGHEAGVPLSYEGLSTAREAPSAVYNRVARILPDGQLDDAARQAVEAAGSPTGGRMSKGSPQAQEAIASLKAQLLDPDRTFTGQQMVNELRGLRQEGFTNAASDDVSNQQLGKAQLDVARALEAHIGRNIPTGGDVTLGQFQAARKALAKNWSVQSALRGNDVDLRAVGRVYRADPELLDGGMKVLGEFAEGPGKDVVGIPERYNPASPLKDLSGVVNVHRPVQSTLQGIPGVGSAARRFLTGNTEDAVRGATRMFPGQRPGTFDPIASLRAPPGRVGELTPVQGTLGDLAQADSPLPPPGMHLADEVAPGPQTPMGDFAHVMSEGLEQGPSQGLSLTAMGVQDPHRLLGFGVPNRSGWLADHIERLKRGDQLPPIPEAIDPTVNFRPSPEVFGAQPVQGGSPQLGSVVDDFGNRLDLERSNSPGAQWESTPANGRLALGDRLAAVAEPEVAPSRGRVDRFGDQSPVVGSEGRVKTTRTGEPSLGDLLNDLQNLVGGGVPDGTAVRASTRTGPSKPWLVDEDKPGNQRGFDNLMEDIHGEDPFANNASGQTDVSQEFANWQAERKAAGISRYRYDPATEEMVPLHSTSARDPASKKGRPVFDQDANGEFKVIDRGGLSESELKGIIARMKKLGAEF